MFENADASIMLSSLSRLPSLSASALKSASLWLSWNFSELVHGDQRLVKSVPVVSLTMLKNSVRSRSSDS